MVETIRELCKKKGVSLMRLEKECGCANGTINKWDNKRPSVDKLKAVADYFGVSMEFLLTGKEKQPSQMEGLSAETLEIAYIIESLPADRRHFLLLEARALRDELLKMGTPAGSP